MRIGTTIVLAAVVTVGSIASLPRMCAEGSDGSSRVGLHDTSCGDRYDALLVQAKASLIKGDRAGAINSLVAARHQLLHCQEMEERNSIAAIAVALNSTPSECTE